MTQAFNLAQLANNINSSGQLDATDGLTGSVSVANGGTGQSSLTANNVLLGNGSSGIQFVAPSTSGNALISNGTTWQSGAISKLSTATGSAPSYSARAWATFNNSTLSIQGSGNVSSITSISTGISQVNFATALPDGNGTAVATSHAETINGIALRACIGTSDYKNTSALTANYVICSFATGNGGSNGTNYDTEDMRVVVFR